jgi:hypothetical protein
MISVFRSQNLNKIKHLTQLLMIGNFIYSMGYFEIYFISPSKLLPSKSLIEEIRPRPLFKPKKRRTSQPWPKHAINLSYPNDLRKYDGDITKLPSLVHIIATHKDTYTGAKTTTNISTSMQ